MSAAVATAVVSPLEDIQQKIHALSAHEKLMLSAFIESELAEDEVPTSDAHLAVLDERVRQVQSGAVKPVSTQEMARRLEDLLR